MRQVVPAMAAALAEELKAAKAAERLRNQLGTVMDSSFGRCAPLCLLCCV